MVQHGPAPGERAAELLCGAGVELLRGHGAVLPHKVLEVSKDVCVERHELWPVPHQLHPVPGAEVRQASAQHLAFRAVAQ